MAKKTLGYGFKLSNESWETALAVYKDGGYLKNPKEVLAEIAQAKKEKWIGKTSRPKIFKVTVEVQE